MYKPPENTNRVKTIKSKFENIEKSNGAKIDTNNRHNTRDNLTERNISPLNLQRQLSDPSKRNIKRTPAFRLDKNAEKAAFQRGSVVNKSQVHRNHKPIGSPKMNECDIVKPKTSENSNNKPVFIKSKSSIDFNLLRNKFTPENINNNEVNQRNEACKIKNVSALYTEPIPKSLRAKPCDKTVVNRPIYSNIDDFTDITHNKTQNHDIHNSSTLKLTDNSKSNKNLNNVQTDPFHGGIPNGKLNEGRKLSVDSNSALKKLDTLLELTKNNTLKSNGSLKKPARQLELHSELSDTLKHALKKPLPKGPAPEKPPRTFAHSTKTDDKKGKNNSFLHVSKKMEIGSETPLCLTQKSNKRSDPKYMLNKLETALRNNKLRHKKTVKTDISTTSGEDSDDNIFLKNSLNTSITNKNRSLPSVPDTTLKNNCCSPTSNLLVQALNFNCINGYNCYSSPYTKLNESKSSFFVSAKSDEPVYAEPWNFYVENGVKNGQRVRSISSDRSTKNKRNSLYYLSSPVLCSTPRSNSSSSMNTSAIQNDVPSPLKGSEKDNNPSAEISSLSSFTSESAASTPMDDLDKTFENAVNIKKLIRVFENKESDNEEPNNNNDSTSETPEKRLENLRNTLQETIENGFDKNDLGDGKDSNSESEIHERKMSVDDPTVHKFRAYVRTVSMFARSRPKLKLVKKSTLFDCCLIVEMNADVRRIKFKYPINAAVPYKIEDLCFPESGCGPLDKTINAQSYSLVITNDKGQRTFGYCRRVVPEGSNKCLPIAYCILSKYKSPRFYKKILIELESRHGISEIHRNNLLEAFYFNKFPQPGETVTIKLAESIGCQIRCERNKKNNDNISETNEQKSNPLEDSVESNFVIINEKGEYESLNSKQEDTVNQFNNLDDLCEETGDIKLNLHYDPIYENSDLRDLHELPLDILQKIFASLLLERKVILISCLLSKLSSSVEALQAMIYPFTWPHSFIPVLPRSLWEFVEAPTPIICGILSIEIINKHEIEDGIVVDLDEKCILKEQGDEDKAFSTSMIKAWRKSIAIAKSIPTDQEAHSYHLADAYIHMFSVVLKNYRDYIVNGNFQKEAFISSGRSKGVRRFLKWFTDTSMFLSFVDAVITNSQDFYLFDKKLSLYSSENSNFILDKLLDWK